MARRWLDERAIIFVSELSELGLIVPPEQAAQLIRDRVAAVAQAMRIGEQSARRYLTDDVVRDLARELALRIADERPGSDVLDGPRTIPVALATIGRTIAALAEAAHIRAHHNDDVGTEGALQVISMLGQVVSERSAAMAEPILLPQAALTRGARLLEVTAEMIESVVELDPRMSPTTKSGIASAFARDAATLRALVANHGTKTGPTDIS